MKKNSTKELNKSKIASYSAVAGAVLASGGVNAQVVYQDVNPDAVVNNTNSPYALDFNDDANADVSFAVQALDQQGSYSYMGIPFTYNLQGSYALAQAGNNAALQGLISGSMSTFTPSMLLDGNAINNAQTFGDAGALAFAGDLDIPAFGYSNYPVEQGDWLGQTDKFLGVRFSNGANQHYGWVRLDVAADASTITVKDFAFQAQPSTEILAGESVGLDDVALENKVSIKTQLEQAIINVTPDLIGGEIAMIDMSGRDAKVVAITDINTVVDFDSIDTGVYMLTARFENGTVSKKVYVK
ncbi:MAG: T9SS type A sorting domain-containing protein [Bacteroidota bacterium]